LLMATGLPFAAQQIMQTGMQPEDALTTEQKYSAAQKAAMLGVSPKGPLRSAGKKVLARYRNNRRA